MSNFKKLLTGCSPQMEATRPYSGTDFGSKSASEVFSDEDETEPPVEQDIGDILKNIAKVALPITLGLRHFDVVAGTIG
jgi:hypothetical protein